MSRRIAAGSFDTNSGGYSGAAAGCSSVVATVIWSSGDMARAISSWTSATYGNSASNCRGLNVLPGRTTPMAHATKKVMGTADAAAIATSRVAVFLPGAADGSTRSAAAAAPKPASAMTIQNEYFT